MNKMYMERFIGSKVLIHVNKAPLMAKLCNRGTLVELFEDGAILMNKQQLFFYPFSNILRIDILEEKL